MAGAHVYAGDCAAGEARGDAALRLNAYDPDITGFMGLFKAACGHGAAALPLLQRSLDLDASYAGVPAVTLAFLPAQTGAVDRALAILDRMPSPSNLEPQYLMVRALVLASSGALAGARALFRRPVDSTPSPAGPPADHAT